MKSLLITLFIIFSSFGHLMAQNNQSIPYGLGLDMHVFNVTSTIIVLIAVLIFILTLVKLTFENKIKNKIVDKGISEGQISSILEANKGDGNYINIKWFALMAGIGIGLTIIYYTLPLGIHSLAIMAFSMAFSFLGYHYFLQKQIKK